MTSVVTLPDPEIIESEACAWLAQVDGGNMSDGDIAALKEWIGRSPHHKRTFERMAAHFIALRGPYEAPAEPAHVRPMARRFGAALLGWRWGAVAAMAAAAALALFALTAPLYLNDAAPVLSQTYAAKVGEQRTVLLADGSRLLLNTDTQVNVTLDAAERAVELVYGEALFDVAKDAQRPFRVYTHKGVVKAVGTVFSVRVRKADIEVVVEEGTVELARGDLAAREARAALPAVARLTSGKRAAFNEDKQVVSDIDAEAMDRRLSWRKGLLVFNSDPLAYVVDEVSRYTDVEIVISDPRILALPIGGNFKVGETQALLDALEKGFGIRVERVGSNLVYLSPQG